MAAQLPLTNVITISVSQAQTGVGNYNTSNLAIFTDDVPAMSFGTAGFSSYLSPTQVGLDFGSSSKTYAMANAVFSQQPNILTGGGQLVIILLKTAIQTLTFSAVAASGSFVLNYNGNASASIPFGDTAAQIQTLLQTVTGLSQVTVTGSIASESLIITMNGVYGAAALLTVTSNTLQTSGSTAITVTPATTTPGESIGAAITRTQSLVQYFGIMVNESLDVIGQTDLLAAAAIVQAINKIAFFVSHTQADIATAGMVDLLRSGSFTQTRGLYYGDSSDLNDIVFMASYAGRALSINFSGSNTTQTMHLKALSSVQPDPTITQSILNTAIAAGADTYVSLQGVSCVFCSGANTFFDRVYNLQWFVGALQVAGFNYLATTSTKIPQTEAGMDGLKGAYRSVCEQGITNQYGAPGVWNNPTVFGNPADLILNVGQRGTTFIRRRSHNNPKPIEWRAKHLSFKSLSKRPEPFRAPRSS
jgi:hypothetical protein